MRLRERIALVTGAAGGIGQAVVERLRAEGAQVLASDLVGVESPPAAATLALDVTDPGAWDAIAARIERDFGRLDILVNNAGIAEFRSIENTAYEDWTRLHRVDLDGAFLGIQRLLGVLRNSDAGAIVNIGSVSALVAGHNTVAYGSAKAALRQLTRSVALHCARRGYPVRCNAVHPAFVRTAMLDDLAGGDPGVEEKLLRQIPMRRFVTPRDVADAVAFLASREAGMITGSEIVVDGGLSAGI